MHIENRYAGKDRKIILTEEKDGIIYKRGYKYRNNDSRTLEDIKQDFRNWVESEEFILNN